MTLADSYPIRLVCRLLGVPRSSVYYTPRPGADEAMLKTALLDLAGEWPTYGYRRLTAMMKRLGWRVNAKRVRRWMDELGLAGAPPVRKTRTTDSGHAFPLPEPGQRPENQASGAGVGGRHHLHPAARRVRLPGGGDGCLHALDPRLAPRPGPRSGPDARRPRTHLVVAVPTIHHSDQGVQYAATLYVERLQKLGVKPSMAAIGEPRENGFAERLVRTIKEEEVDLSDYRDFAECGARSVTSSTRSTT